MQDLSQASWQLSNMHPYSHLTGEESETRESSSPAQTHRGRVPGPLAASPVSSQSQHEV